MKRVVFVAVLILALPSLALAGDFCDAKVYDGAGIMTPEEVRSVETAASALTARGADIRVRTLVSVKPEGNLDTYEKKVERECASWRAPNGERKNNLLVFMFSTGRDKEKPKFGIYSGSEFANAIEARWRTIAAEKVAPKLREKKYGEAFVAGISRVDFLVKQMDAPRAEAPAPQVVVVPAPQGPAQIVQEAPRDSRPMMIGVTGVLLLLALIGAYFLWSSNRARKERARAARQAAQLVKQRAAAAVNENPEKIRLLEAEIGALRGSVHEEEIQLLLGDISGIRRVSEEASAAYASLSERSAGDPNREGLSEAEYSEIGKVYNADVLSKLQEADKFSAAVKEKIRSFQNIRGEASRAIASAEAEYASVEGVAKSAEGEGFKVPAARESLADAAKALEDAKALLADKRFTKCMEKIKEANLGMKSARESALAPKKAKEKIDQDLTLLAARIVKAAAEVGEGREAFARISSAYAQSSWEAVRGNGTEAENRLKSAEKARATAVVHASMDSQNWPAALGEITKANASLGEGESFMRSITALERNLEAAKRDAQTEIEAAARDIADAWTYINRHDDDIPESFEDELRDAERILRDARLEYAKKMPDFLAILRGAKAANEKADSVLERSRTEHESRERERQKAASALQSAERAVSLAREYIQDHYGDVDYGAKSALSRAEARLADARAFGIDPAAKFERASEAESEAGDAYSAAKQDFDAAEEARRPPVVIVTGTTPSGWGAPQASNDDEPSGGSITLSGSREEEAGGSIEVGESQDREAGGSIEI